MDTKRYFLSMCTCPNPVRVHVPGRTPDQCERCGGWLPPLLVHEDACDCQRQQGCIRWACLVAVIVLLGAVIALLLR